MELTVNVEIGKNAIEGFKSSKEKYSIILSGKDVSGVIHLKHRPNLTPGEGLRLVIDNPQTDLNLRREDLPVAEDTLELPTDVPNDVFVEDTQQNTPIEISIPTIEIIAAGVAPINTDVVNVKVTQKQSIELTEPDTSNITIEATVNKRKIKKETPIEQVNKDDDTDIDTLLSEVEKNLES